jgi:Lysyl oxidase
LVVLRALCVFMLLAAGSAARAAEPLLPDLIPWANQEKFYMYGGFVASGYVLNKVVYRFTATTANIGQGPLEVRNTFPNLPQEVYQRIYDSEGGVTEHLIGSFPDAFQVDIRKQYLPDFSQYNLRTVLPGNGVGPIVSSHQKTSRAVIDSVEYNQELSVPREYDDATLNILGISVGWADVYGTNLPGQWVEVTGLAAGQYWLEMVVDPFNRIQESDETNNTARILVNWFITPNPQDQPGDFDRDDDVDAADYVLWRNTLGEIYPPPQKAGFGADGDANHRVDGPDYDVWRAHFGVVAASGATILPEPNTASLLLGVAVVLQRRRRAAV